MKSEKLHKSIIFIYYKGNVHHNHNYSVNLKQGKTEITEYHTPFSQ
jgi:hypothetical protein